MKSGRTVLICTITALLLSSNTVFCEDNTVPSELEPVITGIEKTMDLTSFHIQTQARIDLNGKLINDTIMLYSDIDISHGTSPTDLYMTGESSSSLDSIITKSTYEDGIYTVDNGISVTETKKTPEEVMDVVTSLTDLVEESSKKIKTVVVTWQEDTTLYEYELPSYLAKSYLGDLLDTLDIDEIEGAKIDISHADLISTLDGDGLLLSQTLHLEGTIHKSIFAIPASADMSAVFSNLQP